MAIGQPSAQGIASLYRGNPGALDARIKQEQQAKPGMPPDLMKMLALSIDLNEQDAAKRQAALAALQGMPQTATGKPPTVAESLQQQAIQKAKQLAVQQQQQQKGLQALMGQAAPAQTPENPPQPERQGSIDELRSNLGEGYAGGGIVAFNGEDDSDVKDKKKLRYYPLSEQGADWEARMQAARDAEEASGATSMAGDVGRALKSAAEGIANPIAAAWENLGKRQELRQQMEQNRPGFFESLTPEDRAARLTKGKGLAAQLGNVMDGAPTPATPPADIRAQLNAAEARMQPAAAPTAQPVRDLAALAEQKKRSQNAAAAGTTNAPAGSAASAGIATPAESARDKFLAEQYAQTPTQRREEALKRYEAQVGGPDTAAQEAYIKAMQGRVAGMAEPTDPYDRLRNYARKLATAGGRTWTQTGANASAAMEAERLANEQKKFDLLKEIMGESTKVADTKRGYKKEVLAFGEKEYDDAYKNAFEAAKEQGLDDREAKKLAHQAAEGKLNRANALAVANVRADASGGNSDMKATQQAEAAYARDPEAAAIKKMLESPLYSMNPAKAAPLVAKLRAIQASKYAQFGLTMEPAPGAASPGGTTTGWGKASVVK